MDRYLKRLRGFPRPGSSPSTAENKTAALQETDQATSAEGLLLGQADTTLPPAQPKATRPEAKQPPVSRPTNIGKRRRNSADDIPEVTNSKAIQQTDRKRKVTSPQLKINSSASNEPPIDDKHRATRHSASNDENRDTFETAPRFQNSRKASTYY